MSFVSQGIIVHKGHKKWAFYGPAGRTAVNELFRAWQSEQDPAIFEGKHPAMTYKKWAGLFRQYLENNLPARLSEDIGPLMSWFASNLFANVYAENIQRTNKTS